MRTLVGGVALGEPVKVSFDRLNATIVSMVLRALRGQPVGVERGVFVAMVMVTDLGDDCKREVVEAIDSIEKGMAEREVS